jgi:hypothetical protein
MRSYQCATSRASIKTLAITALFLLAISTIWLSLDVLVRDGSSKVFVASVSRINF